MDYRQKNIGLKGDLSGCQTELTETLQKFILLHKTMFSIL